MWHVLEQCIKWFVPLGAIMTIASNGLISDTSCITCQCVHCTASTNEFRFWHYQYGQICHGCNNTGTVSFDHKERRRNPNNCVSKFFEDSGSRMQSVFQFLSGLTYEAPRRTHWNPDDFRMGPPLSGEELVSVPVIPLANSNLSYKMSASEYTRQGRIGKA
jgi:hypothetical protein